MTSRVYLTSSSISTVAPFLVVRHYAQSRMKTVDKLQVALMGLAKSFQKDLNEIAEKVEASNQHWCKFILTSKVDFELLQPAYFDVLLGFNLFLVLKLPFEFKLRNA